MDKEKKVSYKVNKTLSFTEKDRELVEKLEELGYFEKTFNFNNYVKELIVKDISTPKSNFTNSQIQEIKNIVIGLLEDKNIDLSSVKDELSATLSVFDTTLKNAEIDSEMEDALNMEF